MQATEQRKRTVQDTAACLLSPEQLFDLLADPTERQTWDLCPPYIVQEPLAAAPGPALRGARYTGRGTARGIGYVVLATVTAADRPGRYEVRTESRFERAYPDAVAVEEYRIESEGTGSLVHYTVTFVKTPGTGKPLMRLLLALLEPVTAPRAAKSNFRNMLRYAEKHAGLPG
jgi:hypothetical protein